MRFCNCGKLLGNLFPCRPDMFKISFQYNLTRMSDKKQVVKLYAWRLWSPPYCFETLLTTESGEGPRKVLSQTIELRPLCIGEATATHRRGNVF